MSSRTCCAIYGLLRRVAPRNDVKRAALSLTAQRQVEGGFAPLAKFVNIVYTKEKGGYKHAKVKYSKGIPGGGYLHLSQDKGLCPFAIVAVPVFYRV